MSWFEYCYAISRKDYNINQAISDAHTFHLYWNRDATKKIILIRSLGRLGDLLEKPSYSPDSLDLVQLLHCLDDVGLLVVIPGNQGLQNQSSEWLPQTTHQMSKWRQSLD